MYRFVEEFAVYLLVEDKDSITFYLLIEVRIHVVVKSKNVNFAFQQLFQIDF